MLQFRGFIESIYRIIDIKRKGVNLSSLGVRLSYIFQAYNFNYPVKFYELSGENQPTK